MQNILKSVVKDSFIYGIGRISSKIVGFILLPLYTGYLSTAEYGILGILEISGQVLTSVLGFRLMAALHRWYFDTDYIEKSKSIFFSLLSFSFFSALLITIIIALFSDQISLILFDSETYSYLINLLLATVLLEVFFIIPTTLMKLQEKAVLYSLSHVGKLIIDLGFTIYFITSLGRKVEGIYEAKIIGFIIFFLFASRFIWSNLKIKFELEIIKAMLVFSIPLAISSIAGILLSITDRYCLKFLGNLSDVGIYSLGYKLANTTKIIIVSSFQLAISTVVFKIMNSPENKRLYPKLLTYLSFVTMVFVLGFSVFGKELVELLAQNKDYWDAYHIIPIISFSIFFGMLKDNTAYGIYISKKTAKIPLYIFGASLVNLILNILFIPIWSIMGAAFATLVSQIILFFFIYRYSYSCYPVEYELNKIFKLVMIGLILVFVSLLINNMDYLIRVVVKFALVISFPLIMYFFDFYDKNEIKALKKLLGFKDK